MLAEDDRRRLLVTLAPVASSALARESESALANAVTTATSPQR